MTRRDLLKLLLASAIAEAVDVEQMLWTPKPIITVPAMRRRLDPEYRRWLLAEGGCVIDLDGSERRRKLDFVEFLETHTDAELEEFMNKARAAFGLPPRQSRPETHVPVPKPTDEQKQMLELARRTRGYGFAVRSALRPLHSLRLPMPLVRSSSRRNRPVRRSPKARSPGKAPEARTTNSSPSCRPAASTTSGGRTTVHTPDASWCTVTDLLVIEPPDPAPRAAVSSASSVANVRPCHEG
jgi:hypothetical protein